MMKRFLATGVLALCLMTSQIARANEKSDAKIKAEMVENYLLWQEAWKLKDAARLISFESPDFTHVEEDEVRSKSESDMDWRYSINLIKKVYDARVEIKKLTVESNRIIVLSKQYFDADMYTPDRLLHRISTSLLRRDIWVEYDRSWMLKRTEDIDQKTVIDGK